LKKIFKSKDKESCEVSLKTKGNLPKYALLTGIAITDGRCSIIMVDISGYMLCVNELTDSEKRYHRLFETAEDGILILDENTGMIKDVNPYLMKMLGYSKEQFLDKAIWEIGFFKDIATNKDRFLELQKKKYVHYEDLPIKRKDGQVFYV